MLRPAIKKLMLAKGIKAPHAFLTKRGFSNSMATRLLNNQVENIRMKHIESLCYYLYCQPTDLFEWVPEKAHPLTDGHPLETIVERNEDIDFVGMAHMLTKDELRGVAKTVQGLAFKKKPKKNTEPED